ncbi:MAG: ArnT family glycosyltransferase [Planctomycetota bacterium]|jgi:hypothetical protein
MPVKKNYFPLIFLVILCLGIGVYKISVMACVSRDTVTFMEFAEDLKTTPADAIRTRDQHPGYPAIILGAERVLSLMGFDSTLENRIAAAQTATLLSRIIALCFLYFIFQLFGDKKTALVSAILFMLIPKYANDGSEILSDWPNLMLMSAALFFSLHGLRTKHVHLFLWAGVFSGLAYWIRPEGAVFVVVMGIYTLIHGFRAKSGKLWACLGVMIITTSLITAPYMLYKGALFPKKKVGTFTVANASLETGEKAAQSTPFQANIAASSLMLKPIQAVLHFAEELFNTIFLLALPLLWILLYKAKRFGRLRGQDQFLCVFTILWLVLMVWLHCNHGYISSRHIMPMVIFGFAWIFKGIHRFVMLFDGCRQRLHRNAAILIGIAVAIFVPKLIRPAHADKAIYPGAGVWLRENTPEEATLAVFDIRIGFYAERPWTRLKHEEPSMQDYLIVKSTTETGIPESARRVSTGQAGIDAVIEIYAVDTKENHEEPRIDTNTHEFKTQETR